jgi:hypothetical protein
VVAVVEALVEVGSDSAGSSWTVKPNGGEMTAHENGRWPANVCHDGSDEVMEAFAVFGESASTVRISEDKDEPGVTWSLGRNGVTPRGHTDAGTSAR